MYMYEYMCSTLNNTFQATNYNGVKGADSIGKTDNKMMKKQRIKREHVC